MNKFDLLNKVTLSTLKPQDKTTLTELILRANDDWECWPSVARLCKARGVAYEKNFKKIEHYLPGLVRVERTRGQNNRYFLNVEAILALREFEVEVKETPSREGNPPSRAGVTPLPEQGRPPFHGRVDPPSTAGTNSSMNSTENISGNSSIGEPDGSPNEIYSLEIEEWEEEGAGPEEPSLIPEETPPNLTLESEIEEELIKAYDLYGEAFEERHWSYLCELARDTREFRLWDKNAYSRVLNAAQATTQHVQKEQREHNMREYLSRRG